MINLRLNDQWFKDRLANEEKQLQRLKETFENEAKVVETMEKMAEEQHQDQNILQKYSNQDNHIIKVHSLHQFHFLITFKDFLSFLTRSTTKKTNE